MGRRRRRHGSHGFSIHRSRRRRIACLSRSAGRSERRRELGMSRVKRCALALAVPAVALTSGASSAGAAEFRSAWASWYGPGLWGNVLGCGDGRLHTWTRGVAHRTMACGTKLRICAGRCSTARVIDRGPFVAGREFDLTAKTAGLVKLRVGSRGVGRIHVRRIR